MADEKTQPNWTQIPDDILLKIAQTFTIYSNYIHLRAVCRAWRTALPANPPATLPCQVPWLLLPSSPPSITTIANPSRTFYNILTNKLHTLSFHEASYPRRILGSSHGYLIITSGTPEIFCLNPLTNAKVFLPSLASLPGVMSFSFANLGREYLLQDQLTGQSYHLDLQQMRDEFIRKIVVSSKPSVGSPTFALAIVTSFLTKATELVFCDVTDTKWEWVPISDFAAEDVIYCESQGLFYAVSNTGEVVSFRICISGVYDVSIWESTALITGDLRYLVMVNDELMLLTRHLSSEADIITYCELYRTVGFEVFRFCTNEHGQVVWNPVGELGNGVVFVGESSSLALKASDYPKCKGNCIYFTDEHSRGNDVGVFDLGDESIDALPCFPDNVNLPLNWESPIWITPNPH